MKLITTTAPVMLLLPDRPGPHKMSIAFVNFVSVALAPI